MFHWRSWFLFDLRAHDISTDLFFFLSIHEKKKTSSEYTEYACMRDSSTAPGQACLSLFGDLCRQTLPPSKYMYLELGVWTHASATLRQSHAADRAFDFAQRAKGTHAA